MSSEHPINLHHPVKYHLFAPNERGLYVRKKYTRMNPEEFSRLNSEDAHRERLNQLSKVVSDLKASHGRLSDWVYRGQRNLYKNPE